MAQTEASPLPGFGLQGPAAGYRIARLPKIRGTVKPNFGPYHPISSGAPVASISPGVLSPTGRSWLDRERLGIQSPVQYAEFPTEAADDPGRKESEERRDDRNLIELLQELRVASIGVQVLFGFLLSLPFSTRFGRLDHAQRTLYLVTVLLTVLAIAELSAPVAYHRVVFRQHKKDRLVRAANVLALCGLGTVALSLTGAVLLLATVLLSGPWVAVVALCPAAMFLALWVVLPVRGSSHGVSSA